jgi:hypothetical protein
MDRFVDSAVFWALLGATSAFVILRAFVTYPPDVNATGNLIVSVFWGMTAASEVLRLRDSRKEGPDGRQR